MPEEKKVFRTVNSLFYNSQCLFVEFHDVIAMPWLTMLKINLDSEAINKIFKVDGFSDYSTNALLEWYIYRKKRNIYEEIGVRETINPPEDFYDEFLKLCMTGCDYSIDVYKVNTNLKFAEIEKNNSLSELDSVKDEELIKQLIPLFYNSSKGDIENMPQ